MSHLHSCSTSHSGGPSLESTTQGTIDLDEIMVSAAHARRPKGVKAEHLSKIWKIDLEDAERALGITT
jgi:hypothetical protein